MGSLRETSVSSVILAGGYGKRMGGEKLFMMMNSLPLVVKVIRRVQSFSEEIFLSVAPRQISYVSMILSGIISQYNLRLVEDGREWNGPLAGIYAGLKEASFPWVFVCACDMPCISDAVVRTLWHRGGSPWAFVIVPRIGGYYEPLHAFYNKACLPAVKKKLDDGQRKITAFYDAVPVSAVDEKFFAHLPEYKKSFGNLNSKNDILENVDLFS